MPRRIEILVEGTENDQNSSAIPQPKILRQRPLPVSRRTLVGSVKSVETANF